MKLNWGVWLYGLISGFIGGGASAVVAGVVLPGLDAKDFNFGQGFHKLMTAMGAFFVVHGVLVAMAYLAKSPLPQVETTVSVATTTQEGVPPKVVTTISEKSDKPIAPTGN